MALAIFLFILALLVAIGYVIWAYRKKSAEKAAARSERYQQLFAAHLQPPGPVKEGPSKPTPVTPSSAATRTAATAIYARKERLLSPQETLLYYVLKAGLPDHEIFARVNLSAILEVARTLQAHEREQRSRKLALHNVDFVICDKSSRIVAAVEFEGTGGDSTGEGTFKVDCLKAAGIRHVRVKAATIPRREDVRALICGSAG